MLILVFLLYIGKVWTRLSCRLCESLAHLIVLQLHRELRSLGRSKLAAHPMLVQRGSEVVTYQFLLYIFVELLNVIQGVLKTLELGLWEIVLAGSCVCGIGSHPGLLSHVIAICSPGLPTKRLVSAIDVRLFCVLKVCLWRVQGALEELLLVGELLHEISSCQAYLLSAYAG